MNTSRVAITLLLLACPSAASPAYPGVIEGELKLRSLPVSGQGCLLCHQTESGGANTVTKPFGRSMRSLGASGGNNGGSLVAALRAADAQGTDSDGDGTSDIDELRVGRDPNVPQATTDGGVAALPEQPPLLETGCAAGRRDGAGRSRRPPLPATVMVAILLCTARRRARSARRHPDGTRPENTP